MAQVTEKAAAVVNKKGRAAGGSRCHPLRQNEAVESVVIATPEG